MEPHFLVNFFLIKKRVPGYDRRLLSVDLEELVYVWEENHNEILIDDLLDISEEDIGIVLQN